MRHLLRAICQKSHHFPAHHLSLPITVRRAYSGAHLSTEQVQNRLLSVLASFSKATPHPTPLVAKFTQDLGLDSLDVVEVVMAVEEEFGLEIPDEVADSFTGPGDVLKYLETKLIEH